MTGRYFRLIVRIEELSGVSRRLGGSVSEDVLLRQTVHVALECRATETRPTDGASRRSHFPLIAYYPDSIAVPPRVVVRYAVDAHADIRIDVAYQIVTVFHQTLDDRGAVYLVHLVVYLSRSGRPV